MVDASRPVRNSNLKQTLPEVLVVCDTVCGIMFICPPLVKRSKKCAGVAGGGPVTVAAT